MNVLNHDKLHQKYFEEISRIPRASYKEEKCVNSGSKRRFGMYRNNCCKQNPYCQSSKIVSNIQLL